MALRSGLVAIVDAGAVREYRDLGNIPVECKPSVLPVEDIRPPLSAGDEYGAATVELRADKVVRTFSIISAAALADAEKERSIDALGAAFRILFNHENRIRALEGKAAVTAAQFRAALKALL